MMGNTDPITKSELRQEIVPLVKTLLSDIGHDYAWSGHRVYTHPSKDGWRATVVYEGTPWAAEFCEAYAGLVTTDDEEYEVDEANSFEIRVGRWDDGRSL